MDKLTEISLKYTIQLFKTADLAKTTLDMERRFMMVLTDPDDIRFFSLAALIGRLKIEISTGVRWRQSNIAAAKRVWKTKSNTKVGTLKELEAIRDDILEQRLAGKAVKWPT